MAAVRVLYLQPAAAFGGAERQAAQNIALLPSQGIEVIPFVGPGLPILHFLEDAGIEHRVFSAHFPDDPPTPDRLVQLRRWPAYVRATLRILDEVERTARRHRCHLVFASRPFAWVAGGMAARRIGLPAVWRAGTAFSHAWQAVALRNYSRRWPPAALICNSSAVMEAVAAKVASPTFLIENGIDCQRFRPGRQLSSLRGELGIPEQAPVVAFVARLAPEKGLGLLIQLAARLRATVPGVRVLVAGDSGWRALLEAEVRRAGLGGTVLLLGYVREVERVYAAADVVVSTSIAEWCSNTLLEAMAMGRAVVATRVGGTTEIIRDGIGGVLVEPGDPDGFARAVAALLRDSQRRQSLGVEAMARVRARYSASAQVARVAEVIRWAAAGHGVAPAPVAVSSRLPAIPRRPRDAVAEVDSHR